MAGIFISYRREDSAGWTGRLADDLRRAFPQSEIFYDLAAIDIGEDFAEAIRRALASSMVTVAVVGPHWLDAADERGARRLDDADDWVRFELTESLGHRELRVVPVLVGGAEMPKAAELPEPLKALARRNAHEISDKRWKYDVSELVSALRRITGLAAGNGANTDADATATVTPAAAGVTVAAAVGPTTTTAAAVSAPAPKPAPPAPFSAGLELARDEGWQSAGSDGSALEPGTVFRDLTLGPEMIVVPPGKYLMGNDEGSSDSRPRHRIHIQRSIAVGRFEITFDEWDVFLSMGGTQHNPDDQGWGRGRRPVINVSWQDAYAYVQWLSGVTGQRYRLLSESEWEYVARADSTSAFPWDEHQRQATQANVGIYDEQGKHRLRTRPVGSYSPNRFGVYDVIGNVWEWVQDCYHPNYKGAPGAGAAWETADCALRVARGGAFSHTATGEPVTLTTRRSFPVTERSKILGFRVAREL